MTDDVDMEYTVTDMPVPCVEHDLRESMRAAREAEQARAVTAHNCEVLQAEINILRSKLSESKASRAQLRLVLEHLNALSHYLPEWAADEITLALQQSPPAVSPVPDFEGDTPAQAVTNCEPVDEDGYPIYGVFGREDDARGEDAEAIRAQIGMEVQP